MNMTFWTAEEIRRMKDVIPTTGLRWEDEERANYDLETMRQEFKDRLYAKPVCEKCGGRGYWEDAIGPLLCGKWEEVYEGDKLVNMKFVCSDHASLPADNNKQRVKVEMNLGRLSESGEGIASKRYGDPEDPMRYQAVPVYCPNPLCGKEKVVTGGTKTWPRCDDCDEPMRREHELPENQKA